MASPSNARYAVSAVTNRARKGGEATLRERLRLRPLSERAEEHEPEPEERVRHAEGDERSLAILVEQRRQEAADADGDGERRQPRTPPRQQRPFLGEIGPPRGVVAVGFHERIMAPANPTRRRASIQPRMRDSASATPDGPLGYGRAAYRGCSIWVLRRNDDAVHSATGRPSYGLGR